MKIPANIVGAAAGPRVQDIDARWLMAHAAALGETAAEYFDTTRAEGVLAHPLFSVCYEWPVALDLRSGVLPEEIAPLSVHATHDLTLHRRPRPGDRLSTTATITLIEPRPPGAYLVTRFETVDPAGRLVTTTDYGSLYLGVECEPGETQPHPDPLPGKEREAEGERQSHPFSKEERAGGVRDGEPDWTVPLAISPHLAHIYTECARIWNPIHTDRAVALAAGLPDIILHGTATLALAVSATLRHQPSGIALNVRRITCRFGGMVRLPSTLTVQGWKPEGDAVAFRALGADGRPAVRDGKILLAPGH